MKSIYSLLVALCFFSYAANVIAANEGISMIASLEAANFQRARSSADLLHLLDRLPKNKMLLEANLKSLKMPEFKSPQVSMPNETTIEMKFAERTIQFGFENLKDHRIFLNGKSIKLESFKTSLNYLSESELILSTSGRSAMIGMLIPTVYAQGIGSIKDWASYYSAILLGRMGRPEDLDERLRDGNLAAAISRAYVAQMDAEVGKSPDCFDCSSGYDPIQFECNGNHLSKLSKASGITLVRTPQGYRFSDTSNHGFSTHNTWANTDSSFVVKASNDTNLRIGSSLKSEPPFFHFPSVAERCCAQNGCYQKVQAAITQASQRKLRQLKAAGSVK